MQRVWAKPLCDTALSLFKYTKLVPENHVKTAFNGY